MLLPPSHQRTQEARERRGTGVGIVAVCRGRDSPEAGGQGRARSFLLFFVAVENCRASDRSERGRRRGRRGGERRRRRSVEGLSSFEVPGGKARARARRSRASWSPSCRVGGHFSGRREGKKKKMEQGAASADSKISRARLFLSSHSLAKKKKTRRWHRLRPSCSLSLFSASLALRSTFYLPGSDRGKFFVCRDRTRGEEKGCAQLPVECECCFPPIKKAKEGPLFWLAWSNARKKNSCVYATSIAPQAAHFLRRDARRDTP